MRLNLHVDSRQLLEDPSVQQYEFIEHRLGSGVQTARRTHPADHRTFVVVEGAVHLHYIDEDGNTQSRQFRRLEGWHAQPGSIYGFSGAAPARLLEAGSLKGSVLELDDSVHPAAAVSCLPLSGYRVTKPWGHEVWYTHNIKHPGYVVKKICMTARQRSSLQSHRLKTETNYVVEGEVAVLNGLAAPDDVNAVIDVAAVPITLHTAGSAWSSTPNMLHRVIARSTYTSIEVSTPEVDDVLRWADDTGRPHGRVQAEHDGGFR